MLLAVGVVVKMVTPVVVVVVVVGEGGGCRGGVVSSLTSAMRATAVGVLPTRGPAVVVRVIVLLLVTSVAVIIRLATNLASKSLLLWSGVGVS